MPSLTPRTAMEMPDSPQPSPTSSPTPWTTTPHSSLPVSYRVAIALDIFVIFMTFAALIFLAVYIKRRYVRRREEGEEEDLEMKCCGDEDDEEDEIERAKREMGGGGGRLKRGVEKDGRGKGHVRWNSSVETVGSENGGESWSGKAAASSTLHQRNGSKDWESDTWGSKASEKKAVELGLRTSLGLGVGVAMGRNGRVGVKSGSGNGVKGDGTWMRGSLWKGYQVRGAEERRAAAL